MEKKSFMCERYKPKGYRHWEKLYKSVTNFDVGCHSSFYSITNNSTIHMHAFTHQKIYILLTVNPSPNHIGEIHFSVVAASVYFMMWRIAPPCFTRNSNGAIGPIREPINSILGPPYKIDEQSLSGTHKTVDILNVPQFTANLYCLSIYLQYS